MALPSNPSFPWLLYAYPWMPYPRRVIIYLREKGIPPSLVTVVPVSDPQDGNQVTDPSFPPRPAGSLPILAIASEAKGDNGKKNEPFLVRQSMAIIYFLEEACEHKMFGFDWSGGNMLGRDISARVRVNEVLSLAEECTVAWNPVRTFGTKAGTMSFPQGSKEMLRWIRRSLMAIETWWQEADRDMSLIRNGAAGCVTIADIVLYQFLEFTKDCYGVDMAVGSGQRVKDVYGREVVEMFPKLEDFFAAFRSRESARRGSEAGEVAGQVALRNMQSWAEGVL